MKRTYVFMLMFTATVVLLTSCKIIQQMEEDDLKRKMMEKPQYVISVHQIVKHPRATMLEMKIPTFSGRAIWINVNPFIHSRNIRKIELIERKDQKMNPFQDVMKPLPKKEDNDALVPTPEEIKKQKSKEKPLTEEDKYVKFGEDEPKFYDLKLYLDRRGALAWMQLSAAYRHEDLALIIDGIFYRTFRPRKVSTENDETVILEGPIDETCAYQIRKYAKKNYNHFKDKGKMRQEREDKTFKIF